MIETSLRTPWMKQAVQWCDDFLIGVRFHPCWAPAFAFWLLTAMAVRQADRTMSLWVALGCGAFWPLIVLVECPAIGARLRAREKSRMNAVATVRLQKDAEREILP
jgi:hypothetical protein